MSIKLSELKNENMLLVGEDIVISKEDYINEIQEHIGKQVYTTTEYRASIDAKSMLEDAIESESQEMYEDWEYDVWDDITEENIKELQNILDRILSRSSNVFYTADKKVEIDIFKMKFFEFNKYEYYALILASNEEYAKIGYKENIADIDEEEESFRPNIITKEEALERFRNGAIEGCETKEDKIEDFNKLINNFNEYVSKGSEPYMVFLIDGSLI
ncbi:hypothetical protein [uncultured Clostridium sp.]|jgi:hypothetical protein|uniref:hypothetical protein n=1 Tax=uncultured Clostridium sp. TaxID=59620 RepID=UPI00280A6ED3|nr:hypothetical protein [uncultured Clostridium sp.]